MKAGNIAFDTFDSTPEVELIYMNQNPVYNETITLNTDNITYGSGTYELYYSSSITGTRIKNLFNYILNDTTPHMVHLDIIHLLVNIYILPIQII